MKRTAQLLNFIHQKCYSNKLRSTPRLLKIAYICDWVSSIDTGSPISEIDWVIQITGIEPNYKELDIDFLENNLNISDYSNIDYLRPKDIVLVEKVIEKYQLTNTDIGRLKDLVNSTYPAFLDQKIGSRLDLASIADMYRHVKTDRYWDDKTITDQETNALDSIHK